MKKINFKVSKEITYKEFRWFVDMQLYLIDLYDRLTVEKKDKLINGIKDYFIDVFLNGNVKLFNKLVIGCDDVLLNKEELHLMQNKYDILFEKFENDEIKSFFLLDLVSSKSDSDAIIVNNDLRMELYNFN